MIATGSTNKKLQLWKLDKLKRTTFKPQKFINFLTYSPDGKIIATSDESSNTVILSTSEGKLITSLRSDNPKNVVRGIAFSPDSDTIATTSKEWNDTATTSSGGGVIL